VLESAVIAEDNIAQALELEEKQNVFFSYPIQKGTVEDIDGLEAIVKQILYYNCGWKYGEEGNVVMVEPVLNSRLVRERLTQLMFEQFNVSSYFTMDAAVASLYAIGKSSGIVVNMGHEKIDIAPVLEGCMHPSAATRIPIGGKHMTETLQKILAESRGIDLEFEDAERMKRTVCDTVAGQGEQGYTYMLPDGQEVCLSREMGDMRRRILEPRRLGIDSPDIAEACIHAGIVTTVHGDRESRKTLMSNIFVCGGSSAVPSFSDELIQGIASSSHASLPPSLCYVPEYMPSHTASHASWFGGAVIGNCLAQVNAQMGQQVVTKAEYHECGPNAIHRHCC